MAVGPGRRMRKVMYVVLSKGARYSEVLQVRHFECDGDVDRAIPRGDFLPQLKRLCMLKEKIYPAGYS